MLGKAIAGLIVVAAIAGGIYWYRDLRIPQNVAYVTGENGRIDVIDLASMRVVRTVKPDDVSPRGEALTEDGKYLITAAKDTSDIAIFSTPQLKLVARQHTGDNPEYVKLDRAGDRVFATFEPGSEGGPPKAGPPGADDDDDDANSPPAQIASFDVGTWAAGPVSTAGKETEGMEFSADGKYLIVANEAQNNIGIFDATSGRHIRDVDLKPYGMRPRGVKESPQGNSYAITMESSGTLLKLDADFRVLKSVSTAAKPYGVAFDRAGGRIFVAANTAQKLQIFSADNLDKIAEIPVGLRCWHFTFTPDDSKLLLACGRSNSVMVFDANSYKPVTTITGFDLPWGIITYPRSYGSLGLP
jgi:DNA-binding beta-propeller fold protein YncE